jgi:hypothetical protein
MATRLNLWNQVEYSRFREVLTMRIRIVAAAVFAGLLHANALASEVDKVAFFDGRWHGGINTGPNSPDFECWASTTFADGTTLTLTERKDGNWRLELSNAHWQLPHLRRYALVAQVDFYPRLPIAAVARKQTVLEIADLDRISLLGLIENGHTLDLISDDFNDKVELEGSAKVIERIRKCVAGG